VEQEAVEETVELVHGREVYLENEAVLACDAVALHHLGDSARQLGDFGQPARVGPDPHVGGQGQPERGRVEVEAVAPNDARLLQPAHAFGHSGRRHTHPPPQLRHRQAGIVLQLLEQPHVDRVEQAVGQLIGEKAFVL